MQTQIRKLLAMQTSISAHLSSLVLLHNIAQEGRNSNQVRREQSRAGDIERRTSRQRTVEVLVSSALDGVDIETISRDVWIEDELGGRAGII
jgi:hypothetical protein